MQIWTTLTHALQLLAAITMIGLVLIQHGKGADMGASFGSGASGSLFGATGSANFLSRATGVCATVFFLSTLALAYMGNSASGRVEGSSVLDRAPAASAAASAVNPGAIPGAVPGAIPGAAPGVTPSLAPAASSANTAAPAASRAAGEIPKQ